MRRRPILCAAGLCMLTSTTAHAQAGRADLRYAATSPMTVTYTQVDTMRNVIPDTPMGAMTIVAALRGVTEFRFAPGPGGLEVTAVVKETSGSVTMPMMGEVPVPSRGTPEPVSFTILPTGPAPDQMQAVGGAAAAAGADPAAAFGAAQTLGIFSLLPGREIALGGTWTDTMNAAMDEDGLVGEVKAVTNGTYAADTTVNGRRLHVLRIQTRTDVETTGEARGTAVQQTMSATATETVLWDPARRLPYRRETSTVMETRSVVGSTQVQVNMSGSMRSIVQLQEGG
jgi:hypothetical protein